MSRQIPDWDEGIGFDIKGLDDTIVISAIQAKQVDSYKFIFESKQIPAIIAGLQTKKDKWILALDLSNNALTDSTVTHLIQSISAAGLKIHKLFLQNNLITDVGIGTIAMFIKKDKHLAIIYLKDNPFSEKGVQQLFLALKNNTTLKEIDLVLTELYSSDTQKIILDTLIQNSTLSFHSFESKNSNSLELKAISKKDQINKYLAKYDSTFSKILLKHFYHDVSTVVRREISTHSSTGVVNIKNFFKGLPLLVNFEYVSIVGKKNCFCWTGN